MIIVNTIEDFGEDCCRFSLHKWQKVKEFSFRIQAIKRLLDFFNSDAVIDSRSANEFKSITHELKTDFDETLIALVQLIDTED